MRTSTLRFSGGTAYVTGGILLVDHQDDTKLLCCADPSRALTLLSDPAKPPLIAIANVRDVPRRHLVLLSLVPNDAKDYIATTEFDNKDRWLFFVDTFDPLEPDGCGAFAPEDHSLYDERLPFGRVSTRCRTATYGFVLCGIGDAFVVRSTGGITRRVRVCEKTPVIERVNSRSCRLLSEFELDE